METLREKINRLPVSKESARANANIKDDTNLKTHDLPKPITDTQELINDGTSGDIIQDYPNTPNPLLPMYFIG